MTLTAEEIQRLEELEKAAPSGEWRKTLRGDKAEGWIDADGEANLPESPDFRFYAWAERDGATPWLDYIVALRNAAPALLAAAKENARLRAELFLADVAGAETPCWYCGRVVLVGRCCDMADKKPREALDEAQAENVRLREALERIAAHITIPGYAQSLAEIATAALHPPKPEDPNAR